MTKARRIKELEERVAELEGDVAALTLSLSNLKDALLLTEPSESNEEPSEDPKKEHKREIRELARTTMFAPEHNFNLATGDEK